MEIKKFIENLKPTYDNAYGDNLGKDFYSPCLENCKQYKRMTGEFRSSVIFDWGKALLKILDNEDEKCIVKIIANPSLNAFDAEALKKTIEMKDDNFWNEISDKIYEDAKLLVNKDLEKQDERDIKLKIFAYLVAKKKLILKFGFPRHIENPGMFHWKKGMFYFDEGLKVGFNGGPNESHGGHERNIEGIDVFTNINGEDVHINDFEYKFDLAWDDKAPGFQTKPLSKKTLDKITLEAPKSKKEIQNIIKKAFEKNKDTLGDLLDEDQIKKLKQIGSIKEEENELKENYLEVKDEKWRFQQKAREKFIKAKCGILEMATGTGKTRTALSIVTQLIKDKEINNIIIQLEKDNLISQWEKNIREWLKTETYEDINLLKFAQNKNQLEEFTLSLQSNIVQLLIVSKHNLPKLLKKINKKDLTKTIIIHDEVHGLFSDKTIPDIEGLQKNIKYRLGLSATIENKFEPERTKILFKEIGEIVDEYPLKKAIQDGVLVEFDLIRLDYKLLESDRKKRSRAYSAYEEDIKNGVNPKIAEKKKNLKLSAIKKNCVDKVRVFENNFNKISKYLHRSFIYANEKVYVDRVLNVLVHKNINFRKHTDGSKYENIIKFSNGEIDCLLNCEKLSEGIDVKDVNNIVLFATPQGIQLIQRLGRVLRTDSKFPQKRACVIDFFEEDDMEKKEGSDYNRYKKLKELSEIKKLV
ncbi:DEAD/DEAH box helicase family protein [Candidatus Pelagibacter sp. HIMB1587]|uniref:DEAD/DEAH box helicase family protein n=1 Tax=Candidatus Pelagibacter sp. HIMB1587 TaxID=3413354 RepID=UPI003F879A1D